MAALKPYYEHGGITIYHGDCLAVMPALPDGCADVIVTDPPYGTKTNQREGWMVGEFSNVMPLVLPQLHRIGTANAAFYLFTSWKHMADWVLRCSPYFRMQNFLIWDKQRHSGSWGAYSWQFCWEGIYYGIKGPRPVRKYMSDILRSSEKPKAAMQKPTDVLGQLIEASSDEGQMVLDPFIGTGSTLVAAKRLRRRAIGIEIDERYCEIAAKRLAQECFDFAAVPS